MEKYCILDEERLCVDCGDCLACDLDPEKLCDNCMRCVQKSNADYLAIEIDEVIGGTSPDDDPGYALRKTEASSEKLTAKPAVRTVRPKTQRKRPT